MNNIPVTQYDYTLKEFNVKYNKAITQFANNNEGQLNNLKYFLQDRTVYQTPQLKLLFLLIWAASYYKINEQGVVQPDSFLTTKEVNNIFLQIEKLTNATC